jgi:hypothetical protein
MERQRQDQVRARTFADGGVRDASKGATWERGRRDSQNLDALKLPISYTYGLRAIWRSSSRSASC